MKATSVMTKKDSILIVSLVSILITYLQLLFSSAPQVGPWHIEQSLNHLGALAGSHMSESHLKYPHSDTIRYFTQVAQ